jgi:hypothetical protein
MKKNREQIGRRMRIMFYGFSLCVALCVVATAVIPEVIIGVDTIKTYLCRVKSETLDAAIEIYRIDTGSYPNSLKQIVRDPLYFSWGDAYCAFGDEFIYNEYTHRVAPHNHQRRNTWSQVIASH